MRANRVRSAAPPVADQKNCHVSCVSRSKMRQEPSYQFHACAAHSWHRISTLNNQQAAGRAGRLALTFAFRSRKAYCSDFSTRSRATRMQFLARPRKPLACNSAVELMSAAAKGAGWRQAALSCRRRQWALDPKAAARWRASATHGVAVHRLPTRAGAGKHQRAAQNMRAAWEGRRRAHQLEYLVSMHGCTSCCWSELLE